jgi:hypothetical protein
MSCIDYNTWVAAKTLCVAAQTSSGVKGYGYAGFRGFGAAPPPPPTGYTTAAMPSLVIAPPSDPNDPCTIAALTPCAPTGPIVMTQNPNAAIPAPNVPTFNPVVSAPSATGPVPVTTALAPIPVAGGFNSWGLLAALAAAGVAVALVLTHKKKPA